MSIKYFAFAFAIVGIFVAALVVASGNPATGRAQEAEAPSLMPQLYWVDGVTGKIQRTNRDDHTVVEDVVASGLVSPRSIALDVAAGKMYWTDSGERKIQRANLDGSGVEDLVTSEFGLLNPVSIALDLSARRMYWADRASGRIQRASLDGAGAVTLVAPLHAPYQIALDVAGGKIYWTEHHIDKIRFANLDGSELRELPPPVGGTPRRWRACRLHRTCKDASEACVGVLGRGIGTAETGACSAAPAEEIERPPESGSGFRAGGGPRGGLSGDPPGVPG